MQKVNAKIFNFLIITNIIFNLYISINIILAYVLIAFFGFSFIIAVFSVLFSILISLLIAIFLLKEVTLYYNSTVPLLIIISLFLIIIFIVGSSIYALTYKFWDSAEISALAFYIIAQGELPSRASASLDTSFYPLGSAILISVHSILFLGNISPLTIIYRDIVIDKYLPHIFDYLARVNSFFVATSIFSLFFLVLGITLTGFLKYNKKNYVNLDIKLIIFSFIVVSTLTYVLVYPLNTNATLGTSLFTTIIALRIIIKKRLLQWLIITTLLYGILMLHYTILIIASLYILLSFISLFKEENKNILIKKYMLLLILLVYIFIIYLFLSKTLYIYINTNSLTVKTWEYLEFRTPPYLEVEPGIFGKLFDTELYVKYKLLKYFDFLINQYMLNTRYLGLLIYVFTIIGIYKFIKSYKNIAHELVLLIYSTIIMLMIPLLSFTRLYIFIQILILIFSLYGFLAIANIKNKLIRLVIYLSTFILLAILLLFLINYIKYFTYIPDIINIEVVKKTLPFINETSGRVLFPSSPQTSVLWAFYPDKVLGFDPRHISVTTRVETSIIFDLCYTSVGRYNFTTIPSDLKKNIIDKYNITLIFVSKNCLISKETSSKLGLVYVGSLDTFYIWKLIN